MKSNKKIKRLVAGLMAASVAFLFLISLGLSLLFYQSTEKYALSQILSAVKTDNYKKFIRYVPKFKDGKVVDQASFEVFADTTKTDPTKLTKLLLDENNFKVQTSYFKITKFYPSSRYIEVTSADPEAIINLSLAKNFFTRVDKTEKSGPYLPASYKLNYSVKSQAFGEINQAEKFDLSKQDGTLDVDSVKMALSDSKFQKNLLQVYVDFQKSSIDCVANGLDYSKLKNATMDEVGSYIDYGNGLKQAATQYEESFSTAILNVDSLKADDAAGNTLEFDIYTDDQVSATVKDGSQVSDSRHNATITLIFNKNTSKWEVNWVDFQTYTQDPKDWQHQQKISLKSPATASWKLGQLSSSNSF